MTVFYYLNKLKNNEEPLRLRAEWKMNSCFAQVMVLFLLKILEYATLPW